MGIKTFFAADLLKEDVAIITGGGTGIGLAIAKLFSELGAAVVLTSRKMENLQKARDEILKETGKEAIVVAGDVRKEDDVKNVVTQTREKFGEVTILINNAAGNFRCETEKLSFNGWKSVTGIVLDGTFLFSREVFSAMKENGGGSIVNIIATYSWTGNPQTAPSASAKAGVETLTKTLALEWAKYNIRVNAVAPGATETEGAGKALWSEPGTYERIRESVPLKRFAAPDEIAHSVVFLVSDAARYITGETLVVDGGHWLNRHGKI